MKIPRTVQLEIEDLLDQYGREPAAEKYINSLLREIDALKLKAAESSLPDQLCFVGYSNGDQISYALEDKGEGGTFYSDTTNGCIIPLYMLKTHWYRIESSSKTGFSFEKLQEMNRNAGIDVEPK